MQSATTQAIWRICWAPQAEPAAVQKTSMQIAGREGLHGRPVPVLALKGDLLGSNRLQVHRLLPVLTS